MIMAARVHRSPSDRRTRRILFVCAVLVVLTMAAVPCLLMFGGSLMEAFGAWLG